MMISSKRSKLLMTGGNGFVAKNILLELLNPNDRLFSSILQSYSEIYSIDVNFGESFTTFIDFSVRIIPIQLNLIEILDENSLSRKALCDLLKEVDCVIHTAAIVDTRENDMVRKRLQLINVDVMETLLYLSNDCGVRQFIHMSSASACNERDPRILVPWYFKLLGRSLLTSLSLSTYAQTKRVTEEKIQEFLQRTERKQMKVAVVKPHTVWGKGDPLATDIMLQWKSTVIPQPFIGDPDCKVVAIHVKTLAKYILLALIALKDDENNDIINGKIFNVGEQYLTLKELHREIVRTRGNGRYTQDFNPNIPSLMKIPHFFSTLIIFCVQQLDYWTRYRLPYTFFRLVTANNLAYTYKDLVGNKNYINSFISHGQLLFNSAKKAALKQLVGRNENQDLDTWLSDGRFAPDMSQLSRFKEEFDKLFRSEKYDLISNHPIAERWQLGPISVRNRVIKAATFESMCNAQDGVPTEQLIDFHRASVAGGAGMTVVAYASVSFDGRSFPTQICLSNDSKSPHLQDIFERTIKMLARLTEAVHQEGSAACIQLTHAGAFHDPSTNLQAKERNRRSKAVGPSKIFNPLTLQYSTSLEFNEKQLQRIEDDFANAVIVCQIAGFDAIELHLGHGYLLSQFLSRRTNSKYANNPEARLAFPLRVLKRVIAVARGIDREYLPPRTFVRPMAVLVKFNVSELTEDDLPLSDARLFARAFVDAGADLLVPSGGHVMVNGLHMLRGRAPISEMANAQSNWLKSLVVKMLGPWLIPEEPYREAFFLERVLSVCLGAGIPLNKICLIGGLHDEITILRATGRSDTLTVLKKGYGFAAVQMGRMLLADPSYCLKVGIAKPLSLMMQEKEERVLIAKSDVNCCDNSNRCIVDATMALKPLTCSKYENSDW